MEEGTTEKHRGAKEARLLLRPWAESDAAGLRRAIDEDSSHLKPWLGWMREEPADPEQTRERLARWIRAFERQEGWRWAVVPERETTRILGGANLNARFGPDTLDVGYWVRKSAVRQGIASAAVSRLVVHAFEDRRVPRLVLQADQENVVSAAFAAALGFQAVGPAMTEYRDGTPRPVVRFQLLRQDYDDVLGPDFRARAERVRLIPEL